jgi:hypothetical protein
MKNIKKRLSLMSRSMNKLVQAVGVGRLAQATPQVHPQ